MFVMVCAIHGLSLPPCSVPPDWTLCHLSSYLLLLLESGLVTSRTVFLRCLDRLLCVWNSFWTILPPVGPITWFSRSPWLIQGANPNCVQDLLPAQSHTIQCPCVAPAQPSLGRQWTKLFVVLVIEASALALPGFPFSIKTHLSPLHLFIQLLLQNLVI